MHDINMDVDDGVSEASSIASDRLGDVNVDNDTYDEILSEFFSVFVDAYEELNREQYDREDHVHAALIQNVRNISHDLSVALRDL
jgi:hypothetical protein